MFRKSILWITYFCISSCVSLHELNPPKETMHWKWTGFIAAAEKNRGFSAALQWSYFSPDNYRIELQGPLGMSSMRIDQKHAKTTYQDNHHRLVNVKINDILQQQIGFSLPLQSLNYWLLGKPTKDPFLNAHYDENHRLVQFTQYGFTIGLNNYKNFNLHSLPTKILITRETLRLKLILQTYIPN